MDKNKMYAHVYFDIPGNTLGIAIYSLSKIPGFSGNLDPKLEELTGTSKAYDLFLSTLGKDPSGESIISQEELQQGHVFEYNRLEKKVKTLDLLGKLIANDKEAQVVLDLDDLDFWFQVGLGLKNPSEQDILKNLSQTHKDAFAKEIKDQKMKELKKVKTVDELNDALHQLYIFLSRSVHSKTGPKDYKEKGKYSQPSPPTFLTSKENNILYYPGFRGAHHMRQTPGSSKMVYPSKASPEQKWMKILIPNTTEYLGAPLRTIEIEKLDYIVEVLARIFYFSLSSTKEFSSFNQAASAVAEKAKEMLGNLEDKTDLKYAGLAEAWLDLGSGNIYKNEQQVISVISQRNQEESQEEMLIPPSSGEQPMQLAAKLAEHFLSTKNIEAYIILKRLVK